MRYIVVISGFTPETLKNINALLNQHGLPLATTDPHILELEVADSDLHPLSEFLAAVENLGATVTQQRCEKKPFQFPPPPPLQPTIPTPQKADQSGPHSV